MSLTVKYIFRFPRSVPSPEIFFLTNQNVTNESNMSASIASLKMPKENNIFVLCTLVIVIGIISVSDGDIPRPRGVSRSSNTNIYYISYVKTYKKT